MSLDVRPPQDCALLRRAVDTHGKVTIDSVDALPNVDVPLPMQQLKLILGDDTTLRLHELAQCYLDTTTDMPGQSIICYSPSSDTPTPPRRAMLAGSFARRYVADTSGTEQPLTSFHFDSAAVTVNVALSDDADVTGGKLLGVFGGRVQHIERSEGEASVHSSSLLHGVSRMHSGVRYSLILFFSA